MEQPKMFGMLWLWWMRRWMVPGCPDCILWFPMFSTLLATRKGMIQFTLVGNKEGVWWMYERHNIWMQFLAIFDLGSGKIILLYSGYVISPGERDREFQAGWNREHVWPRSKGPKRGREKHVFFRMNPRSLWHVYRFATSWDALSRRTFFSALTT